MNNARKKSKPRKNFSDQTASRDNASRDRSHYLGTHGDANIRGRLSSMA